MCTVLVDPTYDQHHYVTLECVLFSARHPDVFFIRWAINLLPCWQPSTCDQYLCVHQSICTNVCRQIHLHTQQCHLYRLPRRLARCGRAQGQAPAPSCRHCISSTTTDCSSYTPHRKARGGAITDRPGFASRRCFCWRVCVCVFC